MRQRKRKEEKERGARGNRFWQDIKKKKKKKMATERLTKIPSGKIIQEIEKETKELAGEQDWLLMA